MDWYFIAFSLMWFIAGACIGFAVAYNISRRHRVLIRMTAAESLARDRLIRIARGDYSPDKVALVRGFDETAHDRERKHPFDNHNKVYP